MKLIQKLNLVSLLFILLSSVTIVFILQTTLVSNYREVEYHVHEKSMTDYYRIITQYFEHLDYVLSDWSSWNATYDFIEGQYDDYIEDNISFTSYDDFGLDYIAIYDEDLIMLYGETYNADDHSLSTLNPSLSREFINVNVSTGILSYKDQLILYSGRAISDNEGKEPHKGLMVFAYILDKDIKEDLAYTLGTDITLVSINQNSFNQGDIHNPTPDEENPYHLMVSLSRNLSKDGIGRIDIPYLNSPKALRMEFNLGQSIQALGRKQIQTTMILVIASLVFFSILMALALWRMVISRVAKLNKQVNSITTSKDLKGRVNLRGLDELGELSEGINQMLIEIDKFHEEAHWYANHDEMTGSYNRRAGIKLIEDMMNKFSETEESLTITYIDIDGLKKVNDSYGHLEGDRLITDMVTLMNYTLNKHCHIVRIGGDEFIIACENQDKSTTLAKIQELQTSVEAFNAKHSRVYQVSFSYGLASYQHGMAVDDIIEKADQQMYRNRKLNRQN